MAIEIRSVTLRCCDDVKALLADYYSLCIIIRFKREKVPHGGMSTFFGTSTSLLSLSPLGFSSMVLVFSSACKMHLQIHHLNWLLPPSCLSTLGTADAVSSYCSSSEWQQSAVNDKENGERWLTCMTKSLTHLWLDCWTTRVFVSSCVSVTDTASGVVAKSVSEHLNAVWF